MADQRGEVFFCRLCQKVYRANNTQEEAEQEMLENYGEAVPEEERVMVCDGCYAEARRPQRMVLPRPNWLRE